MQEKISLRRSIAERLERLSEKDRAAESRSIVRRIREHLPEDLQVLCAYMPMPTEPDIRPLIETLLTRSVRVYLPRTEGKAFTFRRVTDLDHLEKGPFGVLEPQTETEELDPTVVQLALVPGVAFDPLGNRLGRGNGGYDRWLADLRTANATAQAWGIAFDCQMVNIIPTQPHDAKVDAMVTPRGMQKVLSMEY
jgi:5-formyltetrahydrofolate cyclo-ligase